MASEKKDWRLSADERQQTRLMGVTASIAAHFAADESKLKILTTKNVRNNTLDGVFGFMEVTVEYTDADKWHWHSLRFNGEKPIDLSDEHLTLLGSFACSRATESHDFTVGPYGIPLHRPEPATIHEMPLTEVAEHPPADIAAAA